jgi:CheY-like chemotaxis protein
VLHVDDGASFGALTEAMLSSEDGWLEVESVTDAKTAKARLDEGSFDCVVSDYGSPETDGLELLRWVRRKHGSLPFVLFTGHGSESGASKAMSAGVTECLQKESGSGQFAVLANCILNVVDRERAERERELWTEREHVWMALEHTPVVAFRLDTDLRYAWVGKTHPEFDAGAVLGKRDDELLDADAAEAVLAPKREALETGELVSRRVSYELPGGPVTPDLPVEPL